MTEFQLKYSNIQEQPSPFAVREKYNLRWLQQLENLDQLQNLVSEYNDGDYYSVSQFVIRSSKEIYNYDNYGSSDSVFVVDNKEEFLKEIKIAVDYHYAKTYINFVNSIVPILDAIYPNNYDLQFDKESNHLNLLIKFDTFTIINSNRNTRDISGLYVLINFEMNGDEDVVVSEFRGFRSTYDLEAYKHGYAHSHLHAKRSGDLFRSTNFCTGSTGFTAVLAELRDNIDLEKFELFLYDLDNYVRWESLEGTPYIRMATTTIVNSTGSASASAVTNADLGISQKKFFKETEFIPNINASIVNGELEINILNERELMLEVAKYATVKGMMTGNNQLVQVERVDKELIDGIVENAKRYVEFKTFRNEEIKYEVQYEGQQESEEEFPHPQIFQHICNSIKERYKNQLLSRSFQSVSFPEHLKQDLVSM